MKYTTKTGRRVFIDEEKISSVRDWISGDEYGVFINGIEYVAGGEYEESFIKYFKDKYL